jgi:hypothetical protein
MKDSTLALAYPGGNNRYSTAGQDWFSRMKSNSPLDPVDRQPIRHQTGAVNMLDQFLPFFLLDILN